GASAIGVPGCPDSAFCTASIESVRTVLIARRSSSVVGSVVVIEPLGRRNATLVIPRDSTRMKLAISSEGALIGGAAGALIGFFVNAFKFNELSGGFSHLSPSQIVLIGLILGAIVGALGRYRILLGVNAFLAVVYFVVAYTPVMEPITRTWVRSDPVPPSADAIVVLSAAVTPDTALNAEGTERLLSGLELFQRGVAPRIFTSHVNTKYPDGPRSSTPDQERLIRMAGASAGWVMLDS